MLQPFTIADALREQYRRYVRTGFPLKDPALEQQREALIDDRGLLWTDPFVSLSRPGTSGPALDELHDQLLPETLGLPWGFEHLYAHQAQAIDRLRSTRPGGPASTLVLSGTGSGKTESFLIPIIDACLRDPSEGVKAVVIYPMNALANDQLKRLTGLLAGTSVTFGRYTGDAPETDAGGSRQQPRPGDAPDNLIWSRQAMRETPPQVLITNYLQLELLLLRGRDRELFRYGPPKYLVVDEIHLFAGVLGAEVGALLRRFRQHVELKPTELTVVGTSATAGTEEQRERLRDFAQRFFGVPVDVDGLIEETPAPAPPSGDEVPPTPVITDEALAGAASDDGLRALAKTCFGLELPDAGGTDLRLALGAAIDRFATVGVVERALERPAPVSAAADALGELQQRAGVDSETLRREAQAIILLGAQALAPATGEPEGAPRLRPRVHLLTRSLTGLTRCLDCEQLLPPGTTRCSGCQNRALPLASCRSCGEAFWSAPDSASHVLLPIEPPRGEERVFLATSTTGDAFDDEDGDPHVWPEAVVCTGCGAWTGHADSLVHAPDCPTPHASGRGLHGSTDGSSCPACGAKGSAGRDVITPQRGAAAASVAVLTQMLGDELRERYDEADARLLVFADSRQDAGQQAGYADDQGARVTVRQTMLAALAAQPGPCSLGELLRGVKQYVSDEDDQLRRWLIGEARETFIERSEQGFIPSDQDRKDLLRQLEWDTVLELTERARRRFSLEGQGLISVDIDALDEITASIAEAWPDHPFGSPERLSEVTAAVIDAMRFSRAVDHRFLVLKPSALRSNHGLRIGDRAVTATRGYAEKPYANRRQEVDIKRWHSDKGDTRIAKLVGRAIGDGARTHTTRNTVDRLVAELRERGVLVQRKADGKQRAMVDANRLHIRPSSKLFRCPRCGHVRGRVLRGLSGEALCISHNCGGVPEPWEPPAERDFYRRQYEASPRRLVVREHSGQIESDVRLALERAFNEREPVTVDVLACTPTLEVGVSLDDLNAVILRNLPPSPANYAQRVGRAGRRSKVALAVSHAGNGPHDSYFFEQPAELIAGRVVAPAISLDNEPLLRRHLNSLILETLAIDIPSAWMPDEYADQEDDTVADEDGVVRESVIDRFREALADEATRRRVRDAVHGAFSSPEDPVPPERIDALCDDATARFPDDLRGALMRWSERYRAILDESSALFLKGKGKLVGGPLKAFTRLQHELERMARPRSPEQLPLGFLGLVGFLPKYGATGERALLTVPSSEAPIDQAAHVAVTEYAPGNMVYARGRRLKVTSLSPRPVEDVEAVTEFRENVIKQGRRCDHCQTFTTDLMTKACPACNQDLVDQMAIRMTGVRGSGATITGDDEYRERAAYDVLHALGATPEDRITATIGDLKLRLSRRREITVANRGLRQDDEPPIGFAICRECGYAEEDPGHEHDDDPDVPEQRGHASGCPAAKDPKHPAIMRAAWLIATIRGDVIELELTPGQGDPGMLAWRRTLPEALMLGIRETMQAGRRDLEAFEVAPADVATALVIFDTMPGGTGYLPKLLNDDGEGLRRAAAEALARLESCDCEASCHRCLRDFWNQRSHAVLDRHAVIPTLRRLAVGDLSEYEPTEDERLQSFLEVEFARRLDDAGIPAPTLQLIHRLPDGRITVADAAYADPDISIYLDGRAFHAQSAEKIATDLARRNGLEAAGRVVLEFTYADVLEHFDDVAEVLRRALAGPVVAREPEPPPGALAITKVDVDQGVLDVHVDPEAWVLSEATRQQHLRAANTARLAGWRLHRTI